MKQIGICKCHFCGKANTLFVLSSIYLPKGEAVCNDCYGIGRIALDLCNKSIKFDYNYDNEKPFKVYKVDAFGRKLEVYEREFKREVNAFNYARKLARLYID